MCGWYLHLLFLWLSERGGSVVGSVPCVRKVAGSKPTSRHIGTLVKSFARSCLLHFGMLILTQYQCCSWEHLWVVVDLKRCYRNIQNEWWIKEMENKVQNSNHSFLFFFILTMSGCSSEALLRMLAVVRSSVTSWHPFERSTKMRQQRSLSARCDSVWR